MNVRRRGARTAAERGRARRCARRAELEKPAPLTIWQRIQQWYDEHFGASGDEARGWLEQWLQRFAPSDTFVSYFVILLGIVLVAVTVAIVYNELRVAGVLAGGVFRKYSPLAPAAPDSEPERPRSFDDLTRAPLARRPVLLLALVLDRLRARGVPALRDSLTHRELLGAARLTAPQSAAFGAVLDAAERVTFADWRPAEADVTGARARPSSCCRRCRPRSRPNEGPARHAARRVARACDRLCAVLPAPRRAAGHEAAEHRAGRNGYLALWNWLEREHVRVASLRNRYSTLHDDKSLAESGNVLIITMPFRTPLRQSEVVPLQTWLLSGNTVVLLAALDDSPEWLPPPTRPTFAPTSRR